MAAMSMKLQIVVISVQLQWVVVRRDDQFQEMIRGDENWSKEKRDEQMKYVLRNGEKLLQLIRDCYN